MYLNDLPNGVLSFGYECESHLTLLESESGFTGLTRWLNVVDLPVTKLGNTLFNLVQLPRRAEVAYQGQPDQLQQILVAHVIPWLFNTCQTSIAVASDMILIPDTERICKVYWRFALSRVSLAVRAHDAPSDK